MDQVALYDCARHNRQVFDEALVTYVDAKLSQVTPKLTQGERNVWLDATACVWCLFDDERFVRSGNLASELRSQDPTFDLCVFWSFEDVCMPSGSDCDWVAERIVDESLRQLRQQGLHCRPQTRIVEGEPHRGVLVSEGLLGLLGGARTSRR